MKRLVRVGVTGWVDPDQVTAVVWSYDSKCPVVYCGNVVVEATKHRQDDVTQEPSDLVAAVVTSLGVDMALV